MNYKTFSVSNSYEEIRKTLINKGYIVMTLRKFMKKYLLIDDPLRYVFPLHTDLSLRPKSSYILNLQLAFSDKDQIKRKAIEFSDFLFNWEKDIEKYKDKNNRSNWENNRFAIPWFNQFRKSNIRQCLGDVFMENVWDIGIYNIVQKYLTNNHIK